jgi:hypothetical protein
MGLKGGGERGGVAIFPFLRPSVLFEAISECVVARPYPARVPKARRGRDGIGIDRQRKRLVRSGRVKIGVAKTHVGAGMTATSDSSPLGYRRRIYQNVGTGFVG